MTVNPRSWSDPVGLGLFSGSRRGGALAARPRQDPDQKARATGDASGSTRHGVGPVAAEKRIGLPQPEPEISETPAGSLEFVAAESR